MAGTLAATLTATPVGLAPDRVVDTVVAADHRPAAFSHGRGSREIRKSQTRPGGIRDSWHSHLWRDASHAILGRSRVVKCAMSYDFAVLTPEAAGGDDSAALAKAVAVFESEQVASDADPRLTAFLADLEAAGAADEDNGWVSVWPLQVSTDGVAVPTTYADVDNNLVVLLKLAARHSLVLVDLSSEKVDRPAPGEPIGVMAGDGTRLGALTYRRLESILSDLPSSDPWIVLERDSEVYVQALRQKDGSFVLEYRDGGPARHFSTTLPEADEVLWRMWAWLRGEPDWAVGANWQRVQF